MCATARRVAEKKHIRHDALPLVPVLQISIRPAVGKEQSTVRKHQQWLYRKPRKKNQPPFALAEKFFLGVRKIARR